MLNRRSLLTAAGAAVALTAIPLTATAHVSFQDRITAALADWTAEGNSARERTDFDPQVFAYLMEAKLLVEQDWRFVYPNDPGPTYWMKREAIMRGQIALAYRISAQAGEMMQGFMDIEPAPKSLGRPFRNSDFVRSEAAARTRKRVYMGPPVGGALPRTVMDQYQVRDYDWRFRDVLHARLCPEWVGPTMMALVRTPMGQVHYREEGQVQYW